MKEAGHIFLARMGKKRLRPGGRRATEWLMEKGGINAHSQVLEVACNMGTTAVELARRYGCSVNACDLDESALERAARTVRAAGLEKNVRLHKADATALPFADASFDTVLNEAMLTMLSRQAKEKALTQYRRVLRPGGVALTHDVVFFEDDPEERRRIRTELSAAIHVPVFPLTEKEWTELFRAAGFTRVESLTGPMTLMTPHGMVYDEGLCNALRVLRRALRRENRAMFLGMRRVFSRRKKQLGFIAVAARP